MDAEIDVQELRERLKANLVDHYLGLHITVVSVALAMAGVAAASLITRPSSSGAYYVLPWLLWLGSLLATAVAYAGTMVGAFALPASIPAISDLILPLAMCVAEFLLFAILISQVTSLAHLSVIINTWLVLMATFGAIATLSIARAKHHFVAAAEGAIYSEDAVKIVNRYVLYLRRDQLGAGVTAAVGAFGAGLRLSGLTTEFLDFTFPLALIALLAAGLRGHAETSRMWRTRLSSESANHDHQHAASPTVEVPGQLVSTENMQRSSLQAAAEPGDAASGQPAKEVPPKDERRATHPADSN